jgi:phosphotransferase family enzyme
MHLRSVLGDELFALADDSPSAVVDLEPLVGRGPCSSFRLTFADGQVLKAKRLATAADAQRVDDLLRRLGHPAFPTVLRRRGASILTCWIPGRSLDGTDTDADLLRTCGALHACIHCHPAPNGATRARRRSPTDGDARLRRDLDALVDAGWLARGEAAAALAVADRHAPEDWAVGIVHNDFHAENMIRTDADDVVSVDNESLSVGAYAYDLARTWYRWPMSDAQRVAYLEGYRRLGSTEEIEPHFPFWAVTVLVRGAAFRLRAGRRGIAEPIVRLREQLEIRP